MDAQQVQAAIAAAIQQEQANQQAAIDAAVAAAVAQLQQQNPPQPQQPNPPQPAAFTVVPGANNQVLDYTSREGLKVAKGAVKPLKMSYDLDPKNLQRFTSLVYDKGELYGYNLAGGILQVPDAGGQIVNVCNGYAMRSVAEVRAHAQTYVFTETRPAQGSANLYHSLMNSLTDEAQAIILQFQSEYTLEEAATQRVAKSGTVLYRIIVRESHIDTAFTSREVRLQLSSLDEYMVKCNSDINAFNQHVNSLVMQLKARNEETTDLTTNVLKGYKKCGDRPFVEYIGRLEDRIDDGEVIDPTTLMSRALVKYKVRCQRNEWQAPTAEDEKIVALEAKLETLKAIAAKTTESTSVQGVRRQGHRQRVQEPWMKIKPNEGEPREKMVNGVQYKWCNQHGWCKHTTDQCKNIKSSQQQEDKGQAKGAQNPKMVIDKALSAVLDDTDGSDY